MAFQRPFLISLRRQDERTPWGFRLVGGTDVQPQHIVQQVLESSQAEKAGLHDGDEVIQVGRVNVQGFDHREVQEVIAQCRNRMEMFVIREDLLRSRKENEPPVVKAVVHSSYNSPFSLYSTENVADTLALQTTVLTERPDSPSKLLNHFGPVSPPVIPQSDVLKILKEEEGGKRGLLNSTAHPLETARKKPAPPTPPPKPSVRFQEPLSTAIDIRDYANISDDKYQQKQYQIQQQRYQTQRDSYQESQQPRSYLADNQQAKYIREDDYQKPWGGPKIVQGQTQQATRVPLQAKENYASSYNQEQRATTAQYQQNPPQTRPGYQSQNSFTSQQTISIQPKTQQQIQQEQQYHQQYQYQTQQRVVSSQQEHRVVTQQDQQQISQQQLQQEQIRQHEYQRQLAIQEQQRKQQELHRQQEYQRQLQNQEQQRLLQQQDQQRLEQLRQQQFQQEQARQEQLRQEQLRQQQFQQQEQARQEQIRQEQLRQQNIQQQEIIRQERLRQQQLQQQQQQQRATIQQQESQRKIPRVVTNPDYAAHVGSMTKTGDRVPLTSTSRMTPDTPTMGSPNVTRRGGGMPVWPPRNSSVRDLPRTGFSPNLTHEKGSKKFTWPPPKEEGEQALPPSPTGGVQNAWHPEESSSHRSLPFVTSPPPNHRNKDIVWPPPHTAQRESPKHSPKVIRRKTGSFDDYIYQHASVNVPPTYRTPPGTQHVEIVYEDDF